MYIIPNDGINEKITKDTNDYTILNIENGINGPIVYKGASTFHRSITLQIRNAGTVSTIMKGLTNPEGISLNEVPYNVVGVSPVEDWGVGDTEEIQFWTYKIDLVR